MTTDELPDYVVRNRAAWDTFAAQYVPGGERNWSERVGEETWGIFGVPEADVQLLRGEIAGRDAIELGCGTAYISAWLARRGARPVGIDNSEKQLETARRLQREHGIAFPLIHGNAETVPTPTRRSTSLSPSTARRCGRIPFGGSPRPPGCYAPAGG
jgi:2-polyprenyl-3-methyl-5-hydroxy-6-metoxy-1,4-benzoquinol methylase